MTADLGVRTSGGLSREKVLVALIRKARLAIPKLWQNTQRDFVASATPRSSKQWAARQTLDSCVGSGAALQQAMLDWLEIGELFLSWRLYVGLALTGLLCWLIVSIVSSHAVQLVICIPVGLAGRVLSFRWQIEADRS
jgi:hypothetical protein